jgi:effector-binding domain-containing protein
LKQDIVLEPPEEIRGMLRLKRAEIEQHVQEEQARLARVIARLNHMEQEKHMPTLEVVLKQVDVQHVLAVREIIPTPVYVGTLMSRVFGALGANGIQPINAPIALYHDEEFTLTDMDTEIAIPVANAVNATLPLEMGGQLAPRDLPAIPTAACAIHAASYDLFEETYAALGQWIADNGYRIIGPAREIYLVPAGNPGGPITEIQWPVTKAE